MIAARERAARGLLLLAVVGLLAAGICGGTARAEPAGPFANLAGWWGGQGRLQFKEGKLEQVKCRATYFVSESGDELKQTIRCASASGKIEVVSNVKHEGGKLTGTWSETNYSLAGELSGEVTPKGFRVQVKGADAGLSANMDIIVKDRRQIVEIQFLNSTLVGLTLLLQSGDTPVN